MDTKLPDGTQLGVDWALQHPQDYLEVFRVTVPEVIRKAGVKREQVIGIGIDFTACTMLPVKKNGTPLCFIEEYKSTPNAWVKLWKQKARRSRTSG